MPNKVLKRRIILIGVVLSLFYLNGCGSNSSSTDSPNQTDPGSSSSNLSSRSFENMVLRIGRIPFTNPTEMVRKHEALMGYLRTELGIKDAKLVLAANYDGILSKLGQGDIDVGWLGSLQYVIGKEKYKLKPLVKPIRFGTTSYRGIIITRQDSGIKNLSDLKGKKFAWVEKESASGYIFPKALLLEANIDPNNDFKETTFLTKHDTVVMNVFLGKYDAGACYDDARKTLNDENKMNELTILATTEDIANEPIVCRENLPSELVEKIKKALLKLSIKNPKYKKVIEGCTDVQGFVPAEDSDYNYVRKVDRLLRSHN